MEERNLKINNNDDDTALLKSGLKLVNKYNDTNIIKAEDYFQRFDMEEAIKYSKIHLELFPNDTKAFHILMDANYEAGEFDTSLVYCNKLLETEDTDPQLYARKAFLLGCLKDIDSAVDFYDKAISLNPEFYEAICDKANLLSDCIDCEDEALVTYRQAILVNPNKAEAYMGAASIYDRLGDKKRAIEFSSKAFKLEPDNEFYEIHSSLMKL